MNKTLLTARQVEDELGRGYFYRQHIYRLADERMIESYLIDEKLYFSVDEILNATFSRLKKKINRRFPRRFLRRMRVAFNPLEKNEITIYKTKPKLAVSVNTTIDSEEVLLTKLEQVRKEVKIMIDKPIHDHDEHDHDHPRPRHSHGPMKHHHEMMKRLERIEDLLERIEEKV